MPQDLILIQMIRNDLESIPRYTLPEGFAFKWYEPGCEKNWLDVHLLADTHSDITLDLFLRQFSLDERVLRRRQVYLVASDGRFIGTATAWLGDDLMGRPFGRLHWVAIIPEFQGQGLAKPLLTTVLGRMRDLGHQRAYLNTQTVRIPAINLYAKFGFVPLIRTPEDRRIWSDLQCKLKVPFDLDSLQ